MTNAYQTQTQTQTQSATRRSYPARPDHRRTVEGQPGNRSLPETLATGLLPSTTSSGGSRTLLSQSTTSCSNRPIWSARFALVNPMSSRAWANLSPLKLKMGFGFDCSGFGFGFDCCCIVLILQTFQNFSLHLLHAPPRFQSFPFLFLDLELINSTQNLESLARPAGLVSGRRAIHYPA